MILLTIFDRHHLVMKNKMLPKEVLEKENLILDYIKSLWLPTDKISQKELLLQSFIHKSFAADFKKIWNHNERLEFLWDSVLWACVCNLLFAKNPNMAESEMTLYKIALVREETLAQVAKKINLQWQIFISKWEEKMKWRTKDSILSDCLEALIWYIFIDFWYKIAQNFVEKYVYTLYDEIDKNPVKSYKTMVQEKLQKQYKQIPEYKDIEEKKDNKWNTTLYKSEIFVLWKKKSEGFWSNKKKAQEDAAKNFYSKNT